MTFAAIVAADTLADTLDSVSVLVDECKVNLNEDGIEIRAVDPANVAMTSVELDANAFESYEASGGLIGVDLERLEDVAGFAESGDLIHLELDEETRKLHIDVDGLEYTLALIDPDSLRQEPDIPDLELAGTYVFEGKRFGRAVKAADLCSDHISIEGEADDELVFAAEGDTDEVTETLSGDDLLSGILDEDAISTACRSLFSLDYLKDLRKPIGAETEVSLRVGEEMPAKLQYSLADGDVSVLNMLAPRIQN